MFEQKFKVRLLKSENIDAFAMILDAKEVIHLNIEDELAYIASLDQMARYEQIIELELKSVEQTWIDKKIMLINDGGSLLLEEMNVLAISEKIEESLISLVKHTFLY